MHLKASAYGRPPRRHQTTPEVTARAAAAAETTKLGVCDRITTGTLALIGHIFKNRPLPRSNRRLQSSTRLLLINDLDRAISICGTLTHMQRMGIRALQQNAAAVVRRVRKGEAVEVTDRQRRGALLVPVSGRSVLDALEAAGRLSRAEGDLLDLGEPIRVKGREPGTRPRSAQPCRPACMQRSRCPESPVFHQREQRRPCPFAAVEAVSPVPTPFAFPVGLA